MLKIGITGGIGSGKTTVCKVFETLGIPVFYADQMAKQLMVTDVNLIAAVKNAFGEQSYSINGVLNHKHLADIVFNDKNALAQLNALVHPAVFNAFATWAKKAALSAPYVLKEAALLFESGSYTSCDHTVLVTSPLSVKLSRVTKRDLVSVQEVMLRMDKQFTDEQKIKLANFIIHNTEDHSIILQVLALHQQFLALS
jgi:dephospho-CoA kinase